MPNLIAASVRKQGEVVVLMLPRQKAKLLFVCIGVAFATWVLTACASGNISDKSNDRELPSEETQYDLTEEGSDSNTALFAGPSATFAPILTSEPTESPTAISPPTKTPTAALAAETLPTSTATGTPLPEGLTSNPYELFGGMEQVDLLREIDDAEIPEERDLLIGMLTPELRTYYFWTNSTDEDREVLHLALEEYRRSKLTKAGYETLADSMQSQIADYYGWTNSVSKLYPVQEMVEREMLFWMALMVDNQQNEEAPELERKFTIAHPEELLALNKDLSSLPELVIENDRIVRHGSYSSPQNIQFYTGEHPNAPPVYIDRVAMPYGFTGKVIGVIRLTNIVIDKLNPDNSPISLVLEGANEHVFIIGLMTSSAKGMQFAYGGEVYENRGEAKGYAISIDDRDIVRDVKQCLFAGCNMYDEGRLDPYHINGLHLKIAGFVGLNVYAHYFFQDEPRLAWPIPNVAGERYEESLEDGQELLLEYRALTFVGPDVPHREEFLWH